jgi:hypothetical protein
LAITCEAIDAIYVQGGAKRYTEKEDISQSKVMIIRRSDNEVAAV